MAEGAPKLKIEQQPASVYDLADAVAKKLKLKKNFIAVCDEVFKKYGITDLRKKLRLQRLIGKILNERKTEKKIEREQLIEGAEKRQEEERERGGYGKEGEGEYF